MRIQMIAPTPFFAHRGCHVRILEEIRALQERGLDVALCTYGLGDEVPGVHTVRAPQVPWYRKLSAGPSWHKLYLDLLLLWTSIRFAARFRPDVIHAHLHEGAFLGKVVSRVRGGVPLLGDFQGSMTSEMSDHGFFSGWSWGERVFSKLEGRINRAPRAILVSSRQALPQIAAMRPDADGNVSFLLDGVDARAFRPDPEARAAVRRRLGIGDDEPVVAYLGLLTPYQGVDLLLEAARTVVQRVPPARFVVMGFPNLDSYRDSAARLGLGERVLFTGKVPYEEAPAFLAAADVAVSPKTSVTEANGKLLNYMAVGLPTVVFDSQVNRDILGDLGVYARFGDVADLAAKLVDLLERPDERRRLGLALRRRAVEEFSWAAAAERLEKLYRRLSSDSFLEANPRPAPEFQQEDRRIGRQEGGKTDG